MTAREPLLEVSDICVGTEDITLVDGVTLDVAAGEIVAVVGESGSGKSLSALAIIGLLAQGLRRSAEYIRFDGREIGDMPEKEMRKLRGNAISMIFQEPVASLNPLVRVGDQVAESLIVHGKASPRDARDRAIEMLREVGIPDPAKRARQFPAELSGGMCQRVMIASALITEPRLLIADEPTTALDVTIQAQILALMTDLRARHGTSILIITHDMGVVATLADKVCVMYGGCIMEQAEVHTLFANPQHPYTRLLLSTIPKLTDPPKTELFSIHGTVPDAQHWPTGCRFRTRCPLATDICATRPPLEGTGGHLAACWHKDRIGELA